MASRDKRIVLVTCATHAEGRKIAQAVVRQRLAACVNILPGAVESVYRWKGKVEQARETLLVLKTSAARLRALETAVRALHSYDVPEFIALPIVAGSEQYLGWLGDCLSAEPPARRKKTTAPAKGSRTT